MERHETFTWMFPACSGARYGQTSIFATRDGTSLRQLRPNLNIITDISG